MMTEQMRIDAAIAEIALTADKLPGVLTIHNLKSGKVAYMSKRGLRELKLSLEELCEKTTEAYHATYFNPEDAEDYVPKIITLIERNNNDEILTFFQQVRKSTTACWDWHMSSVRILTRGAAGKPLLVLAMSFPIDAMHHMTAKAARLLEENNFLRRNATQFTKLSNREREILRFIALGKSSAETAALLFIAQTTVETHRKNIRQKLNTNSYYEICQYARAFDLI